MIEESGLKRLYLNFISELGIKDNDEKEKRTF